MFCCKITCYTKSGTVVSQEVNGTVMAASAKAVHM